MLEADYFHLWTEYLEGENCQFHFNGDKTIPGEINLSFTLQNMESALLSASAILPLQSKNFHSNIFLLFNNYWSLLLSHFLSFISCLFLEILSQFWGIYMVKYSKAYNFYPSLLTGNLYSILS